MVKNNTATDAGTDIESEILAGLDFEPVPPTCDFQECEEVAKSKLVCGICSDGCELMCGSHTIFTALAKVKAPDERVVFDKTCGHTPFFSTCDIVSL
jgi:hypothetical protein